MIGWSVALSGLQAGPLPTSQTLIWSVPRAARLGCPHFGFLAYSRPRCADSAPPSLSPLVHDFPCPDGAIGTPRPGGFRGESVGPEWMGVDRRKRRVLPPGLLSPALPGRQGFLLRFGVSSSARFSTACGNARRQSRRASLGKTRHLPVSRPASPQVGRLRISGLALPRLLDPLPTAI
jgi:hypothetical protein